MFAYMKRKPSAGVFSRTVWRNGVRFLFAAVVLNMVVAFVPVLLGISTRLYAAGWVQIAISVIILLYLFTSRRVRDTFADFPVENGQ